MKRFMCSRTRRQDHSVLQHITGGKGGGKIHWLVSARPIYDEALLALEQHIFCEGGLIMEDCLFCKIIAGKFCG